MARDHGVKAAVRDGRAAPISGRQRRRPCVRPAGAACAGARESREDDQFVTAQTAPTRTSPVKCDAPAFCAPTAQRSVPTG